MVPSRSFSHWGGMALMSGGALTLLINAGFTPLLRHYGSFVEKAASGVFLWRMSTAALAAVLLLFGAVGLYLHEAERAGRFGAVAFVLAFLGTALLLANEWNQLFLVRDLARRAPDALRTLEAGGGVSLYDLGALIPFCAFTLGWIALAASSLRARVSSRPGAILVIGGFFAVPILGAAFHSFWGQVAGDVILAAGWFWIGLGLWKADAAGSSGFARPCVPQSA